MKNLFTSLALATPIFFGTNGMAQTPPDVSYQWAKGIGSADSDYGYSIAIDDSWNYLCAKNIGWL